jgi:hypothetical protein
MEIRAIRPAEVEQSGTPRGQQLGVPASPIQQCSRSCWPAHSLHLWRSSLVGFLVSFCLHGRSLQRVHLHGRSHARASQSRHWYSSRHCGNGQQFRDYLGSPRGSRRCCCFLRRARLARSVVAMERPEGGSRMLPNPSLHATRYGRLRQPTRARELKR